MKHVFLTAFRLPKWEDNTLHTWAYFLHAIGKLHEVIVEGSLTPRNLLETCDSDVIRWFTRSKFSILNICSFFLRFKCDTRRYLHVSFINSICLSVNSIIEFTFPAVSNSCDNFSLRLTSIGLLFISMPNAIRRAAF